MILCCISIVISSSGNAISLVEAISLGEQVVVSTNGKFFAQGDTIELKLSLIDTTGQLLTINTFKEEYAGIVGPCGIGYLFCIH